MFCRAHTNHIEMTQGVLTVMMRAHLSFRADLVVGVEVRCPMGTRR